MTAGLTTREARERLSVEGPNALPQARARGVLALAAGVLREPMFLLLIGAATVYMLLGDLHEALVLAASVLVVFVITVVQERRTERALEALRDLSSPRALVWRDGAEQRIAGVEVVRGDLLLLREGDRVAADARLLQSSHLLVDESLLTGESVPVDKRDDAPMVYSGTLVVKGTGRAEVTATGARSELGRIGASLATIEPGKTRLEQETARMVRMLAAVGIVLCVAAGTLYAVMRGDPLGAILAGITLAMAILPEEFPVVLTVFLALGAWRISRHGVLTRRMPAIEMLGAATVLCCDKTGTLTENRMAVAEVHAGGRWSAFADAESRERAVVEIAALACEAEPFDPMERAILAAAKALPPATFEHRYPVARDLFAVANGWRDARGERRLAAKGAPEALVPLCGLGEEASSRILALASEAAARGLRVLAVASAPASGAWKPSLRDYRCEFAGFVALADPVREKVPDAIARCRRAGIRVVMITGDHPETARAIARQAGIEAGEVVLGSRIDALDDAALAAAVREVQVFARVRPEQKLRLIEAYRAAGEVVAMTGDGVNDAPALKAAHIGVAMGRRGTDVAREAASLVLLDDDFTALVATVRLGRRIYGNIRNAMRYLMAVHVPIAGISFVPLVAGWPLVLLPVHVVFLEFVIDPACSIAFEAERSDPRIMDRPPRAPGERLFTLRSMLLAGGLGLGVLAGVTAIYAWLIAGGVSEGAARAGAFTAIVAGNLGLILAHRSEDAGILQTLGRANRAFWWIVAGAALALGAAIYVPAMREIFRFEPLGARDMALAIACGFVPVLWYDLVKTARGARASTR